MDNEMVTILLGIQKEVSETKSMVESLSGPQGRVTKLEEEQRRNFWMTVCIGPALALAHGAARKFGFQV